MNALSRITYSTVCTAALLSSFVSANPALSEDSTVYKQPAIVMGHHHTQWGADQSNRDIYGGLALQPRINVVLGYQSITDTQHTYRVNQTSEYIGFHFQLSPANDPLQLMLKQSHHFTAETQLIEPQWTLQGQVRFE